MAAKGESVPEDHVEAYKWASIAAANAVKESGVSRYSGPAFGRTTAEIERVSRMADTLKAQLAKSLSKAQIEKAKRLAADQLHAAANKEVVLLYLEGDYVRAFDKEILLAEKGDSGAQAMIGMMYEEGKGVGRYFPEALRWYRRAAKQGNTSAQTALADMYAQGKGVTRDYREAVHWYKEAAHKGDSNAQAALGEKYYHGQGVPQDYKESARWYRSAAEQGHAAAQYNLGADFANGQGVPRDHVEAYKWASLSAAQGNEFASRSLPSLANLMTKEQITQAEDLIKKWKPLTK